MQKNSLKYPVEFVEDLFGESSALADFIGPHKVLLVADQNVVHHIPDLGTKIGVYVQDHALRLAGAPVVLAGGERLKLEPYLSPFRVAEAVLKGGLGPDDFVLALGGGTLFDAVGWAVAQVKGSPRLIRVPTTPAAMMGAAFATVASLDTSSVKDALSVPSVPAAVFISPDFAATVLDGVWRAGISEAVRLAAVRAPKMLADMLPVVAAYAKRDPSALDEIVHEAVQLRQKKGGTDLGLGCAANLEPKSGWKLPHGYAVSIGTLIELHASVGAGEADSKTFDDARTILKGSGALDALYHSRHILPPEAADFW